MEVALGRKWSPMYISLFLLLSLSIPWLVISHSTIRSLPGFPGPLPFHLETGYVGVGESNEDQLFYYFVESEGNPREDPLVMWISGGPGCSSLMALSMKNIGPLLFNYAEYDGSLPALGLNLNSWTKVASIIFLDSPIWTGFSYSRGSKDNKSGDRKAAKEAHEFLRKWLIDHPQFFENPLYIGGDSYSGKTVPIIAQEISNGIEAGLQPTLNLKGYLIGNPVTDATFDRAGQIPFSHGMGILSDELYESTKKNCKGDFTNPRNQQCAKDLQIIQQFKSELYVHHILEPNCPHASPKPKEMVGVGGRSLEENSEKIVHPPQPLPPFGCRTYIHLLAYYWANNDLVREILHVRKGTIGEWVRCNDVVPYEEDVKSSIEYHMNLTTRGYRALVYSGDHDLKIPFVGTQAWIRSLNFSIVDDWRSWHVDGQGSGHEAPWFTPRQCSLMFSRWISHKPL
ncbi:serine carboxypeptidase-like protein 18 isoform X1 [Cinnamomum micranthum f. kanehirae]|uniref:Serine carboxypeptidase-like protein 18 isoform X1 n=1 Tax=Cinnamomum micranthum f. kanehirae TaxID=337451 RepID=A0A443N5X5_9MAGN|nr:serine carboxypeptidase-like protein 18 isoform X1 [Cinnamomum micranthum f. kanehirae]